MHIKKTVSAIAATIVTAAATLTAPAAQAVDWCEVLVCMAHPENYRMVPMCINPVAEAFAYAKARQSWGDCPDARNANNSYTEVSSWAIDYHRNKKGHIEGIKSVNGTVNVYVEGKLKMQYPF